MVDSVLAFPPGFQFLDENGDPYSGAKLNVYDSGTTNARTTYSDSGLTAANSNPVVADSAGRIGQVYLPTGLWKYVLTTSADVEIRTEDVIAGAGDTSSFLTGTVSPSRAVISKSTTYTTVAGDLGKQINANSTGGSFTISLLSAVTAGDGGDFLVKNVGTSGTVTLAATGGQSIDQQTTYLLQAGDSAVVRSDAADYHIAEAFNFTSGIVTLTFADPLTPSFEYEDDTDYQLTLTADIVINAPTNVRVGTRGTITVIQDGSGGHAATWNSIFKGNIAVDQTASAVSIIGFKVRSATDIDVWMESGRFFLTSVVEHQEANTTNAGAATLGSFETRQLNTIVADTIGLAVASDQVTVPAGSYMIRWSCPSFAVNRHVSQLYDTTGAVVLQIGTAEIAPSGTTNQSRSEGAWIGTLSVASALEIRASVQSTAAQGAGEATSLGVTEVYARMEIYAR